MNWIDLISGLNYVLDCQRFSKLKTDCASDRWRNSVSDLSMFFFDRANKLERIVKPLRSGAFANRDDSILKKRTIDGNLFKFVIFN